jgi:hypothetical protein
MVSLAETLRSSLDASTAEQERPSEYAPRRIVPVLHSECEHSLVVYCFTLWALIINIPKERVACLAEKSM